MPVKPSLVRTVTPDPGTGNVLTETHEGNIDAVPKEEPNADPNKQPTSEPTKDPCEGPTTESFYDSPILVTFDNLQRGEENVTQPHPELTKDEEELMYWHLRLGHLAFPRVQHMAQLCLLPHLLVNAFIPFCSGCAYGKMTRHPWRTKGKFQQTPRKTTKPGECTSIDQLESSTPGFIVQLKGITTSKRFKATTIFVDNNFSHLGYVYLQQDMSSVKTLKVKQAFEAFAATNGIGIQHYHANNGRFADNAFRQSIEQQCHTISLALYDQACKQYSQQCAIAPAIIIPDRAFLFHEDSPTASILSSLWSTCLCLKERAPTRT